MSHLPLLCVEFVGSGRWAGVPLFEVLGIFWMCQPAEKALLPIGQSLLAGFSFWGASYMLSLSMVWDEDNARENAGTT